MHTTLSSIVFILAGHWVGDFLLQWNALAKGKRSSVLWLSLHVFIYSAVIFLIALYFFPLRTAIQFGALNALFHFFTDLVTSRLTARYTENPRMMFMVIGLDQLIHTLTLITLLEYFWEFKA